MIIQYKEELQPPIGISIRIRLEMGLRAVSKSAVDHVIQSHFAAFNRSVVLTFSFGAGWLRSRHGRRVARCHLDRGRQFHWSKVAGYGIHGCACYGGGALVGKGVVEDWACRSVERESAGVVKGFFSAWESPIHRVRVAQAMDMVGRRRWPGCGLMDWRKPDWRFNVVWVPRG